MLEKRRFGGAGLPLSPLLLIIFTTTLCISLWRFSIYSPPLDTQLVAPTYYLLVPSNVSSLPPPYNINELPDTDRSNLIDVNDFDYRINNFPCNDTDSLLLLVLVHSAPDNIEKRQTIRNTWGKTIRGESPSLHKVLFLLGEVDTPVAQNFIEEENREHRDIIQGSFRDTYRNMTYKHVMALKWTTYYCSGARYLLKTDDDVFVNLPTLVDFLSQELSHLGARRLILCAPFPVAHVKRSYRSKWRVSPSEYPGRHYPSYCAGWVVLYSPDVVFLLYKEAQRSEYFWIDDVHITGTLAARVNLTQTALGPLVLTDYQVKSLIGDLGRSDNGSSIGVFLFGTPNMSQSNIYKLWHAVLERKHPYLSHTHSPLS